MMKKFLLALMATIALLLFGAVPAHAAKPAAAATATFTFDADGSNLPVAIAAADWSKNTGISVTTGDCTGSNCIHFTVVNTRPCDYPGTALIGGCAYRIPDGGCQVEVASWTLTGSVYLDDLITKHEGGHCLWSYFGVSQSFHLPDQPHALMSATHSSAPSAKEAKLTSIDRSFTRDLAGQ